MASTVFIKEDLEMVGSRGIIRRVEFIKIIISALYSLGYDKAGAMVEEESRIKLHTPSVISFLQLVSEGKWDDSITILCTIGVSPETVKCASFVILEQKFLEHLQSGNTKDALFTLRYEISPLCINMNRVHQLAACLVARSQIITPSTGKEILENLQKLIPGEVIVPGRRLEQLVEQALVRQRESCEFHNTLDSAFSLYTDHHCGRSQIPSKSLQVIQAHRGEVWYLQFSHNGKYLASAATDHLVYIWEALPSGRVCLKHCLTGHVKSVCTVSWSPDDSQLLTCGLEEVVRCWDVQTGKCLQVYRKLDSGLVSCGWFPDGKGIFSGATDKSICIWYLDGREAVCWQGYRTLQTSEMAVANNGQSIVILCQDSAIMFLDRQAKFERLIKEDQVITSFSLSEDNKFLLVNLANEEIHLWSLEGDFKVISKYKGHKRSRFVIRSCFGGIEHGFIASGSEDSQVYIWNRRSGELLFRLAGHSGVVNCVSWNPCNPHMMASAGDDKSIIIWGVSNPIL